MKVLALSVFVLLSLPGGLDAFGLPTLDSTDPINKAAWDHLQRIARKANSNFRALDLKSSVAEGIVFENIHKRTTTEKSNGKLVVRKRNSLTLIYFPVVRSSGSIQFDEVNQDMIPAEITHIGIGHSVENKQLFVLVVLLEAIKYPSELGKRPQLLGLPVNSKANLIADAYAIKQDSLTNTDYKIAEVLGPTYGAILFPPTDLNSSESVIDRLENLDCNVMVQLSEMQKDGILASISISALLQSNGKTSASAKYYHWVVVYEWKILGMMPIERDAIWDGLHSLGGLFVSKNPDPLAQKIAEIKSCRPLDSGNRETVGRAYRHRIFTFNMSSATSSATGVKDATGRALEHEIEELGSVDKVLGIGFATRKTKSNGFHLFIVLVVLEKPVFGFEVPNLDEIEFNPVAILLAADSQKPEYGPKAVGEFKRKFNQEFLKKDDKFDKLKSLFQTYGSVGFKIEGRRGGFLWLKQFMTVSIIYCHQDTTETLPQENSHTSIGKSDYEVSKTHTVGEVRPRHIKENYVPNASIDSTVVTPLSQLTPTPVGSPSTTTSKPANSTPTYTAIRAPTTPTAPGTTVGAPATITPIPLNPEPNTSIPKQNDAPPQVTSHPPINAPTTPTAPGTTVGAPASITPTPLNPEPNTSIPKQNDAPPQVTSHTPINTPTTPTAPGTTDCAPATVTPTPITPEPNTSIPKQNDAPPKANSHTPINAPTTPTAPAISLGAQGTITPPPVNLPPIALLSNEIDAPSTAPSSITADAKPTSIGPTPVIIIQPPSTFTASTDAKQTSTNLTPVVSPSTSTIPAPTNAASTSTTSNLIETSTNTTPTPANATEVTKTTYIASGLEPFLEYSFKTIQGTRLRNLVRDAVLDELSKRYESEFKNSDLFNGYAKQCAEAKVTGSENENTWFVLNKDLVAYRVPDFKETSTILQAVNKLIKAYPEVENIPTDSIGVYWHKTGTTPDIRYTFCMVYHIILCVSKHDPTTLAVRNEKPTTLDKSAEKTKFSSIALPPKYSSVQNVIDPRLEITFNSLKSLTVTAMLAILENLSNYSQRGQRIALEMSPHAVLNAANAHGSSEATSKEKFAPIKFSNGDVGFRLNDLQGTDTILSAMKKLENFSDFYTILAVATVAGVSWRPEKNENDTYVFCVALDVPKIEPQALAGKQQTGNKEGAYNGVLTIGYPSNPIMDGQVRITKQLGPSSQIRFTLPQNAPISQAKDTTTPGKKMTNFEVPTKLKDNPEKTSRIDASSLLSPPTAVKPASSTSNLPAPQSPNQKESLDQTFENCSLPSTAMLNLVTETLCKRFGREFKLSLECKNMAMKAVDPGRAASNRDPYWKLPATPIEFGKEFRGFRLRNLKPTDSFRTALDMLETLRDFNTVGNEAKADVGSYWQQISETKFMFCVVFGMENK